MDKIVLEAPAKVNLCLAVEYPPRDGYHALRSVFQTLDLHDTLSFELVDAPDGKTATTRYGTTISLDCGGLDLPVCDNLIFKAIDVLECAFGQSVLVSAAPSIRDAEHEGVLSVKVDKRIPAGGGLGGGSSDAAAAIVAGAGLVGADALDDRCLDVARNLGADVAFFLYGNAALMEGRGDVLTRRLPDFPLPLVLMGEVEGISTASVYRAFDADPPQAANADALADAMLDAQRSDGAPLEPEQARRLASLCANNLEPAACAAQPRLAQRIETAKASDYVLNALVTGSGSTSYAICANLDAARAFEREIAPLCAWTHVCTPR